MKKEKKKKEDKKKENKKEDKKEDKEDKKENKKYKKNKIKNYLQNIDNNHKQDSATFLENLKMFDKKFNKKEEKVPNISNNLNQIKNNEGTEYDSMNVNETLIDPYPNIDTNPFRQNGDYLNLAQNQEQINLLRIIADNLSSENQRGISHSVIFIGYIICFLILTNRFANNGGFDYSASRSLYYMIVALSCFISVIYLKEIVKANKKNKNK